MTPKRYRPIRRNTIGLVAAVAFAVIASQAWAATGANALALLTLAATIAFVWFALALVVTGAIVLSARARARQLNRRS